MIIIMQLTIIKVTNQIRSKGKIFEILLKTAISAKIKEREQ